MTTANGGESPHSEGGGGGGRTVEESLTDNSSVEYFLLDPGGSAGGSRRSRRGSRAGPPDADGEILSPISQHRGGEGSVVHQTPQHPPHPRIYFEEEEDDDDDEDELTLPLVSTSQTPRGRPRIRSNSSNFFSRRVLRTELSGLNYLNAVAYLAHVGGVVRRGRGGLARA